MEKIIVDIYRCKKFSGAYIYVKKGFDVNQLPELLREKAGRLELAMSLLITADKKLARAEPKKIMESINTQDFYLQMPDPNEERVVANIPNAKLELR